MKASHFKLAGTLFLFALLFLWMFGPILFSSRPDPTKDWIGKQIPEGKVFIEPEKQIPISQVLSANKNILSFWADWCAPCVHELPQVNKNYAELKNNGILVTLINVNSGVPYKIYPEMKAWLISQKLTNLVSLFDFNGIYMDSFQIPSLPLHVATDAQGKILWMVEGMIDWDLKSLEERF